jgi:hypothetical protein
VLVTPPEERVLGGPLEAGVAVGVAVEVNSPAPAEVDPAAELDPPLSPRTTVKAALALGAPREEEEVDEDVLRAKACSGPNSRLALLANFNACACVEVGWPEVKPPACVVPGTAPVSR